MTPSPADVKHARDVLAWGLVLIAVGSIWYVEGSLPILRLWPYVMLAIALAHLWHPEITSTGRRSWAGAFWLLFIAVWAFLTVNHVYGLDYHNSWPLLMIGGGIWLVWHSLENPGRGGCGRHGSRGPS